MGRVNWPVVILTGPPGSGKSWVRRRLVDGHGYPEDRVLEAHTWPGQEPRDRHEIVLRSLTDLQTIFERFPGCVMVWLESSVKVRHERLMMDVWRTQRSKGSVPDLLAFQHQHYSPARELYQAQASEDELPNPALIKTAARQLIYNTGSFADLDGCVGELLLNLRRGIYAWLRSGERAPYIGLLHLERTKIRFGLAYDTIVQLPRRDISEAEATRLVRKAWARRNGVSAGSAHEHD